MSRLLIQDENAYSEISISGDNAFAKDFIYISKNIRWDVEQDLSQVTGDILAHRIVKASKDIKYWHSETTQNLLEAIAEYWLEEQPLLATSTHVKEFNDSVGNLNKEVDQLVVRIDKLARKVLKRSNKGVS